MRAYIIAFGALLAAVPALAQDEPAAAPPERPAAELLEEERRPFEALYRARQELMLTDAQVGRLQDIARRLEVRNHPLRERLHADLQLYREQQRAELERELLRLPPEQRQRALREMLEERRRRGLPPHVRPIAQEMRRNIGEAVHEAQRVLTPIQKHRARQLVEEQRRIRGGRQVPIRGRRPLPARRPQRPGRP
ncbi:MAG TPA: hypothetical protein VEW03_01470 [Longimicrobiaceae bacterium]|nr:hypothetical protein [Longimicrobiaceae bacterium]